MLIRERYGCFSFFCPFLLLSMFCCHFVKTSSSTHALPSLCTAALPHQGRGGFIQAIYSPPRLVVFPSQSLHGESTNMAADDDGMVFEETSEFTNSEEHFLPPGWEIRTMDDGRIYYAK